MALSFYCSQCGSRITVRFLSPGEEAHCRDCNGITIVPVDAMQTSTESVYRVSCEAQYTPRPDLATESSTDQPMEIDYESVVCPQCQLVIDSELNCCPHCGFDFSPVSLYNPKHFIWQAIVLSPFAAIFLAAMNWGRLGRRTLRTWLLLSVPFGFLFLVLLGLVIPEPFDGFLNFPLFVLTMFLGLYLWQKQRLLHRMCRRASGRSLPTLEGTLASFGFVMLSGMFALGIVVLISLPYIDEISEYEYAEDQARDGREAWMSGWVVTGMVMYEDGTPATDAIVTMTVKADSSEESLGYYSRVNGEGRFACHCEGGEDWVIYARDDEGLVAARTIELPRGEAGVCDTMMTRLTLVSGGCIQGSVRLGGEKDNCGIYVRIDQFLCFTESDCSGGFELSAIPPGTWTLRIHAEGYREEMRSVMVTAAGDTIRILPTTLTPTADLRV